MGFQKALFEVGIADNRGNIKRVSAFSFFYALFLIVNAVFSIYAFASRCCQFFVDVAVRGVMFRVDTTVFVRLGDPVFESFTAVVHCHGSEFNPIFRVACQLLRTLPQHVLPDEGAAEQTAAAHSLRLRRIRVRNKLWLVFLLARNPSLAKYRKHQLTADLPEDAESRTCCSYFSAWTRRWFFLFLSSQAAPEVSDDGNVVQRELSEVELQTSDSRGTRISTDCDSRGTLVTLGARMC